MNDNGDNGFAGQWIGPTVEEQGLYQALRSSDISAYWTVLAGTYVFVPMRQEDADAILAGRREDDARVMGFGRGRDTEVDVYTRGLIPAQRPEGAVFEQNMFAGFVKWLAKGEPKWTLVVNRGTPVEVRGTLRDVATWLDTHPEAIVGWQDLRARHHVRTMWDGPLRDDVAIGLAAGAHLSVMNAVPWNAMGAPYVNYLGDQQTMNDWWGVETVEDWRGVIDELFDREALGPLDVVLAVRRRVAENTGIPVPALDPQAIMAGIAEFCRERGAPREAYEELIETAGWVARVEGWMRGDGVLAPDGFVTSQVSWDLGRAVNMARWGLSAAWCDRATADNIIRAVGAQSAQYYADWAELSAGYVLGRTIKMGLQGDPEQTYAESRSIHRALLADPDSPWRHLVLRPMPEPGPAPGL